MKISKLILFSLSILILSISFLAYVYQQIPRSSIYSHINFNKVYKNPSNIEEYDYIVIGAGTAGSIVASRLSENKGDKVLLVEAGHPDDNHYIHTPSAYRFTFGTEIDYNYFSEKMPFSSDTVVYYPRGKVLGGSAYDYDEWEAQTNSTRWGWEQALNYFKKSENNQRKNISSEFHSFEGEWKISDTYPVHPVNRKIVNAFIEEVGLPFVTDFNGMKYQSEGVGFNQVNVNNGERQNLFRAFIGNPEARLRENLYIKTNTRIKRVVFDVINEEKTAVGVELIDRNNNIKFILAKKEVILSAGAINTPQILMLSGIGDKDILNSFQIPLIHDNKEVGKNLQDHPIVSVVKLAKDPKGTIDHLTGSFNFVCKAVEWVLTRDNECSSNVAQVNAFFRSETAKKNGEKAPDLQIIAMAAKFTGQEYLPTNTTAGFSMGVILLNEKSRGWVSIKSSSIDDAPIIQPNFFQDEDDLIKLEEGLKVVLKATENKGLKEITLKDFQPNEEEIKGSLREFVKKHVFALYHPTSTCSIGKVVDDRLRVIGVKKLRVVDASVMPIISRANTNAPTAMIAENACDMIKEDNL